METKPELNPSAFPKPNFYHESGGMYIGNEGMTLRDYFAAKAMNGLIQTCVGSNRHCLVQIDECAGLAYEYADEMLKQRLKPNETT